ncbi:hypothetical protein PsorP6_009483 [Peronosclerospora sorghi]|uniref:Uncharacterized protein n=1 Tax=Peronosclerospora sorghi TaxID=230839 RepID=A0ACC0VYP7_9STRA|nr:hypothetical protein PsorP6_009483 [Peronosclerospora sorghi]
MPYHTAYLLLVAASAASCAHLISTRAVSFENQSNASLPVGQVRLQPDNTEERGALFQEALKGLRTMPTEAKVAAIVHVIVESSLYKKPDEIMHKLWSEFTQHYQLSDDLPSFYRLDPELFEFYTPFFLEFIYQDQQRAAEWLQWHNLMAHASAQKNERTHAMVHATTATAKIHPSEDFDGVLLTLWKEFTQVMVLERATLPRSESKILMFLDFITQDQNRLELLQRWSEWNRQRTGKEVTVADFYAALDRATNKLKDH